VEREQENISKQKTYEYKFDLLNNGKMTSVKLPFPYLKFTPEMVKMNNRLFLMQGTYFSFDSTIKDIYLMTGPLGPCFQMVAKYCEPNKPVKTLAAHITAYNMVESLFPVLRKMGDNPHFWDILLYVPKKEGYDTKNLIKDSSASLTLTLREVYQGRSQIEELKNIKDKIVSALLLERKQVDAFAYGFKPDLAKSFYYSNYNCVQDYLVIDKFGTVYFSSPINEDLLGLVRQGTINRNSFNSLENFIYKYHELVELNNAWQIALVKQKLCEKQGVEKIAMGNYNYVPYGQLNFISLQEFEEMAELDK